MKKLIAMVLSLVMLAGVVMAAPAKQVEAADTTSDLVAHWKFDGALTEAQNGLSTENGEKPITYVDGVFGKAASFNGKDNYLIVKHDDVLNLGNSRTANIEDELTISFWAYFNSLVDKEMYILDKGQELGWDKNDDCYWSNPYKMRVYSNRVRGDLSNQLIVDSLDTDGSATVDAAVDGNEWKLVTITYDGSTIKLYADNELIKQEKYSEGFAFNEDNLFLGINGMSMNEFFKGYLDDLRIYQRALNYDDIDALYQAGVKANKELIEPTKKLVAYYAFDGNLKDSSDFKNDAEKIEVSGTTKYVIGKNGKAITMSKGNYIRVPAADQLNFDYDFTFSYWVQHAKKDQDAPILYRLSPSMGDSDTDDEASYNIYSNNWADYMDFSNGLKFRGYNNTNWVADYGSDISYNASYNENKSKANNWNHVTFTYHYDAEESEGMLKCYLNGKLVRKNDEISYPNVSNAKGDLYIGFNNDDFFTGAIDELKIYNKELSATEVKKEYQRVDSITASNASTLVKNKVITVKVGKTVSIPSIILKDADTKKTSTIKSSDANVKFATSKKSIFTVTSKGVVKGVKAGKATMSITYGGNTVKYTISVVK